VSTIAIAYVTRPGTVETDAPAREGRSPAAARTPQTDSMTQTGVRLTDVDWSTAKVPAPCMGPGKVAKLRGFSANDDAGRQVRLDESMIQTGNILALGMDVTAVAISCSGASESPASVIVYVDQGNGAAVAGYAIEAAERVFVTEMVIAESVLRVKGYTYSADDVPNCCPDLSVSATFTITDRGLVTEQGERKYQPMDNGMGDNTAPAVQNAVPCDTLPMLRDEYRAAQRAKVELSGGSVEGIPTYSMATMYANMDEVSWLNRRMHRLQAAQTALHRAGC
jgi:hypothetical protein